MQINIKNRVLLIELLDCVFNNKKQYVCIKLLKKINNQLPEYAKRICPNIDSPKPIILIPKLIEIILPQEVFHIQSIRTRLIIKHYMEQYTSIDDMSTLFEQEVPLDELKKVYKCFEDQLFKEAYTAYKNEFFRETKPPKKKKFHFNHTLSQIEMDHYTEIRKMKRDGFEYTKIHDFEEYQLNNNIAFEFAKRRYPVLYIYEYYHVAIIAKNFFAFVMPSETYNFINEQKFIKREVSIMSQKKKINELIKTLREGKSFFNVLNRSYISTFTNFLEPDMKIDAINVCFSTKLNVDTTKQILITPAFRLPKLPEYFKWEVDVKLNLSLPTKQLTAYIESLKQDLASKLSFSDENFFQSINIAENYIDLIKQYNKNIKKKSDVRTLVADILFTYDCLRLNFTKQEIAEELNNYYFDADKSKVTKISADTITAYTQVAIEMIEKEKYKYLVDGTDSLL